MPHESETTASGATRAAIRVWPGVVIVVIQWIVSFGGGIIAPGTTVQFFGMIGGPLGGVLLLFLWWLFASRAAKADRFGAVGLMVAAFLAAMFLSHLSMRMVMVVYALPTLCLAFVTWAVVARGWPLRQRRPAMVAAIVVACLGWTLLRSDGVRGDLAPDLAWRWTASAEDRFLAEVAPASPAVASAAAEPPAAEAEWPGFRGRARDGVIRGVRIATDWSAAPPALLWRRPIGPGWSSFAVAGDRLYTQEQHGETEVVACYRASTGDPVWRHSDPVRFFEVMAGAGPRATPTLHDGRLYTLGATGILNALVAADGSRVWSRDAAADTVAVTPDWGFSGSPLVVDSLVVVHTGGPDGKGVVAYDLATGEPRWFAAVTGLSYSSPHLATIGGVRQILILTGDGVTSLAPADGSLLWQHAWPVEGASRVVQPVVTDEGQVYLGTGFGVGLRRLEVSHAAGVWSVAEAWTSRALKPYFNDFVIHRGHAYGFDGRYLACVALADGEAKWKGGHYGHGQLVLLADQDLLLVLSEKGEIAVVAADPAGFTEVARLPAITGKTWNHPVLIDGMLYIRNGEEMAAYALPKADAVRPPASI